MRIRIPYRQKVTLVTLLFAAIPFLLMSLFYFRINWNAKVEDIIGEYRNQVRVGADIVNNVYLAGSTQKLAFINGNYEINTFLQGNYDDDLFSMLYFYQNSRRIVFDAVRADNLVSGIAVYAFNRSILSEQYIRKFEDSDISKNGEKELEDRILHPADPASVQPVWKVRPADETATPAQKTALCLYGRILSFGAPLAITEIRLDFSKIAGQFLFVIPENSFVAYLPQDRSPMLELNANQAEGKAEAGAVAGYLAGSVKDYYTIAASLSNGDTVVMFLPRRHILNELTGFIVETLVALVMFIGVIFLISEIVSFYLTRRLLGLIKRVDSGIDAPQAGAGPQMLDQDDEFGRLGRRFLELVDKIKEYYQRISDVEMEKKTLELQKRALEVDLLQARINPHFLYNTLSAIRFAFPDKKLEQVIGSMSKYYRIALSSGDNIIKVSQEVQMAEEYLKIQKFAYSSSFEYVIEMDDNVKSKLILKHLLQPIVENSFIHGVSGMESGGFIRITGRLAEGRLAFAVEDNGAGMDQEKVERIAGGENVSMYGGYGLKNVKSRIETHYGEGYGVIIRSAEGQGTTVTVEIPEI